MKILLLGTLLIGFSYSVPAQPIFVPFKGEREIRKISDIQKEIPEIVKRSIQCGDYFLYEVIKGSDGKSQKIIYFQVPLVETDSSATNHEVIIDRNLIEIKLDEGIKIPTALWNINKKNRPRIIIRISKKDYSATSCISE